MALGTVLLADDDTKVREALRQEFEAHDYHVEEASNIEEALRVIGRNDIDAVVVDMRMPEELDGLRLLRAALHYGIGRPSTPVIIFTAFESFENCVDSMKAGASDYIPKSACGENTIGKVVRRCIALIKEASGAEEPVGPWLMKNYKDLVSEFGGQRIAVLAGNVAGCCAAHGAKEIDGHFVLSAPSYEELRDVIMRYPQVRDSLPFIAMLPEKE